MLLARELFNRDGHCIRRNGSLFAGEGQLVTVASIKEDHFSVSGLPFSLAHCAGVVILLAAENILLRYPHACAVSSRSATIHVVLSNTCQGSAT